MSVSLSPPHNICQKRCGGKQYERHIETAVYIRFEMVLFEMVIFRMQKFNGIAIPCRSLLYAIVYLLHQEYNARLSLRPIINGPS
jgi:hypothetical protein